jgi:hypothetical protein
MSADASGPPRVTLRLPPELLAELKRLAAQERRSLNGMCLEFLWWAVRPPKVSAEHDPRRATKHRGSGDARLAAPASGRCAPGGMGWDGGT